MEKIFAGRSCANTPPTVRGCHAQTFARNVVIEKNGSPPTPSLHDGVTAPRRLSWANALENMGAQMGSEVASEDLPTLPATAPLPPRFWRRPSTVRA